LKREVKLLPIPPPLELLGEYPVELPLPYPPPPPPPISPIPPPMPPSALPQLTIPKLHTKKAVPDRRNAMVKTVNKMLTGKNFSPAKTAIRPDLS
jgi:hypothetical protein